MNLREFKPASLKSTFLYIVFGILVCVVLFGMHPRLHTGLLAKPSLHAGDAAPRTDLPSLNNDGSHFKTSAWRGRPYIVNFFASWCPDCHAEHEELMTLAASKATLIGILYKDRADKASAFLDHSGNPYLVVARDADGVTEASWELAGVPETFVVDANGTIRWHYAGVLTDDIVNNQLMPAWESCLNGR